MAAYRLALSKYIRPGAPVLDVGFGLGHGLVEMTKQAGMLCGIDIDRQAVSRGQRLVREFPQIAAVRHYDGQNIPYGNSSFDTVTCIDVLEHVADYVSLLQEMVRVSRRVVLVSTPNRRPEFTRPDGRPMNTWHLREWSPEELSAILRSIPSIRVEWNYLDGPWDGPFECCSAVSQDTLALAPALLLESPQSGSSTRAE